MKHTNKFDLDLAFGQKHEHILQKAIEGKIECKADRLVVKYGNVFVEIEIMVSTAKFYAICLVVAKRKDNIWVLIPTKILKKLMKDYPIKNGGDNYSSKGHIIPKGDLLNLII